MPKKDPRLDAYIAQSAPFAQPILKQLRKVVHAGCPDVEETLKWSMPHFDYKGPLCGMAAFKRHGSFGFWKAALILPVDLGIERKGMGQFGPITTLSDLPPEEILVGHVRKAVELNEAGVKIPRRAKPRTKPLVIPDYFQNALRQNAKAKRTFDGLTYSHQKEYVEWLTEAKRDATRAQRLATALEWLAQGKPRMWKYQPKRS